MKKTAVVLLTFFCFSIQLLTSSDKFIDLKGTWNFAMDDKDRGVSEKWFDQKLNDSIFLPGSMVKNLKGYDITLDTKFTASIYDSSWFFNPRMEKYRKLGNIKMPFWLTQLKHYV